MINIILIKKKSGRSIHFNLSRTVVLSLSIFILSLPVVIVLSASSSSVNWSFDEGMSLFSSTNKVTDEDFEKKKQSQNEVNDIITKAYESELAEQQKELEEIKQYNQQILQSMMMDLAKLQAHIIRLDSLGNRLTDVANLDKSAFDFSTAVAIGGSVDPEDFISNNLYSDFDKRISSLSYDIDNQTKQFDILENLLLNDQLKKIITPAGKPAEKGYISSSFGVRKDPFTGRGKMHKGVDVAGKSGSNVLATAAGIVINIAKQSGYGQVLDIDHGHGIMTRYGHNKSIVVKIGDVVKQGQIIATMGSTGRSTGPHVHYEVLKNGHPINPNKYIRTARLP